VVEDVADSRPEDQALLVGRESDGGEVRHRGLRAAQVPSAGEEVNEIVPANGREPHHNGLRHSLSDSCGARRAGLSVPSVSLSVVLRRE
jgi:hypothetical protein